MTDRQQDVQAIAGLIIEEPAAPLPADATGATCGQEKETC